MSVKNFIEFVIMDNEIGSISNISQPNYCVVRLQISNARRASPDNEATFLATNWIASLSNTERPLSLAVTISCNC